jgi:hypothetical protein
VVFLIHLSVFTILKFGVDKRSRGLAKQKTPTTMVVTPGQKHAKQTSAKRTRLLLAEQELAETGDRELFTGHYRLKQHLQKL